MNQRLLNFCCITSQALTINYYLIYVGSVFRISRKKNEKSLRFKMSVYSPHSFCTTNSRKWLNLRKRGIIGRWKDGLLFIRLELNQDSCLLEIQQKGSRDTRINRDWLILVLLLVKHSKSITWRIWIVPLKF